MFLFIVPILVVAGTNSVFGLSEGTAKFLACSPTAIYFAILAHSPADIADGVVGRRLFSALECVGRNKDLPFIDRLHNIVDGFHVVSLTRKERAFPQRDCLVSCGQDVDGNVGVRNVD